MAAEQRRYLSYLLRLWQERRNAELVWRFSLEDAHTRECHGFTDLGLLFIFLRQQIKLEESDETLDD